MNTPKPKNRQLRIEMPPNSSALYSNTVMISHTPNEVIFDFIQILPNDPRARVQQRIIMTPVHAKMFLNALGENVRRYEGKNGEIILPKRESLAEKLFKGVRPTTDDTDESDESDDEETNE